MPRHITSPTRIAVPGDPPKQIEELVGRINSDTSDVSIARMVAPPGWVEPAQTPSNTPAHSQPIARDGRIARYLSGTVARVAARSAVIALKSSSSR